MDPEATLERLYRDEGARLWWAVVAFSGDRAIADDAVAEAFAQAIVRGADLRDPLAWIWSVAFRLARGELKRRAQQTHVLPETYVATDPRPAEVVEALRALPERQRAAVVLFYYADRSVREVAEILGVRVSTTKVHLHRGRNRLRDLLEAPDD